MKNLNFFALAILCIVTHSSFSQTIATPTTNDELAKGSELAVKRTSTAVRLTGNLEVKAIVWAGTTSSLFYERDDNGTVYSSTITLDDTGLNPDVVISNNGNTILVVYQWLARIYDEVFTWNSTTNEYESSGSSQVSTAVTGFSYGNPKIDVDDNDDVILVYGTTKGSTNQEFFAIHGTVSGTWTSYTNTHDAYLLSTQMGVNNAEFDVDEFESIDVATYNPNGFDDLTFIVVTYIKEEITTTTEQEVLDHILVETSDIQNNSNASLVVTNLQSDDPADINISWAKIDAHWYDDHFNTSSSLSHEDEWAVAVKETNTINSDQEVVCYKGINSGGFQRNVLAFSDDEDDCSKQSTDVVFTDDFITIVWEQDDCENHPSLTSRDVLTVSADGIDGTFDANLIHRYNDNNHLTGNQRRSSVHGSGTALTSDVTAAYYDEDDDEVRYRDYSVFSAFRYGSLSQEENDVIAISIFPNPSTDVLNIKFSNEISENTKVLIYDLTGRVILEKTISDLENQIDISHLQSGHYQLEIIGYKSDKISKSKFIKL